MELIINEQEIEKALDKLHDLCELYIVVKEIIIYFEEVNPEQKSDIQPINELRNAFDHVMRVVAVWLKIKEKKESGKYIITHLDKAFGHVYRAGYDTVDFLSLTLKSQIYNELKGYTSNTIRTVIPNYYSEIRPSIYELNAKIAKFRSEKDVFNNNGEHLIDYVSEVKRIVDFYKEILTKKPALDEFEKKIKSENKKNALRDWIKRIVIGFILVLAGYFLRGIPH